MIAKYGVGPKFVRAYCKARGWRYTAQGAPAEWYAAWGRGLADLVVTALEMR